MKKLCFVYDVSPVSSQNDCLANHKYFFCNHSQKFIPINGCSIITPLNFHRSKFYVSIDDIFKDLPYNIEIKSVREAVEDKTPFIYYASINLKSCSSNRNKLDTSISKILSKELINCINTGQCLLCLDTCEEIALSRYNKREAGVLFLLGKAGIYNFDSVKFLSTISYKDTFKPIIEPILWDRFIRTYREKRESAIDYHSRLLSFKNKKGFRFLFLNNKLKFFRLLLFYLFYINVKDFKNQFIATLCPTNRFFYGEILSYDKDFKRTMNYIGIDNIPTVLRSFYNIDKTASKAIASHKLKKILELQEPSYKSEKVDVGSSYWQYTTDTWLKAGINIVTETAIDMFTFSEEGVFLTEKTYKPIAYKLPFIIYGQPYTLKTLHAKGFKTFSNFWSEDYDNIIDPFKRISEITRIVKEISFLTNDEFFNLLTRVREVVEYNYDHMMQNYDPEMQVKQLFDRFAF